MGREISQSWSEHSCTSGCREHLPGYGGAVDTGDHELSWLLLLSNSSSSAVGATAGAVAGCCKFSDVMDCFLDFLALFFLPDLSIRCWIGCPEPSDKEGLGKVGTWASGFDGGVVFSMVVWLVDWPS